MTTAFTWVGFITLTGGATWLGCWLWFKAIAALRDATCETYWVFSWIKHRRGMGSDYAARLYLVKAIAARCHPDFYEWLAEEVEKRRSVARAEKEGQNPP
jgi:hypothetical protein